MSIKKIFGFIACIISIFLLAGCDDLASENNNSSENKKFTYSMNETATYKGVEYTVTNVEYSDGSEWDNPPEGKKFVIVTIKIDNKSDKKISYNALDYKMLNSQGQEDDETFTTINNDTSLNSGDLAPGGSKTGTLVFEEDANETSLKLEYYPSMLDDNAKFEIVIK